LIVYSYDEITGDRLNTINAIKLTKRDMTEELTTEQMNRPYDSKHSFGKTYGEHREFVELSYEDHCEISDYVRGKGIDFIDTLCSPKCVDLVNMTTIDKIKIASRDLTNIPLLKRVAETGLDVIVSTGMSDMYDLVEALNILDTGRNEVSILHCLSQYPAQYDRLNLLSIEDLKNRFGKAHKIGYSDHSLGNHIPLAAVAMGAEIIEKHVTLDRSMKGTDQAGSSEPQEMKELVHNIRTFEMSKGTLGIFKDKSTIEASKKLERSLAANQELYNGNIITEDEIHMLSPGDGLKWSDLDKVVGKTIRNDIPKNALIRLEDLVDTID
jgi:sialic acid synthase SpsE